MAHAQQCAYFFDGPAFDILPLEDITVALGQSIEHDLNEPARFVLVESFVRLLADRRSQRLDDSLDFRTIVDRNDALRIALVRPQVIADLMPCNLTHPAEKRRLTAELSE